MESSSNRLNAGFIITVLVGLWALVFLTGLAGPSTIYDNDQQRPTAYVLDVLVNSQWVVQEDHDCDITSKPPLFTWCTAVIAKVFGGFNDFVLYLTSALAVLGTAFLIFWIGQSTFNRWAGFWGGVMWLGSTIAFKHTVLARTDALFGFFTFAMVVVALRAVQSGCGWLWVYVLATLSTLTKGPLGILLLLGIAPVLLLHLLFNKQKEDGALRFGSLKTHLLGLGVFFVIAGGWFLLAYLEVGSRLTDKMIGKELVGHALHAKDGEAGMGTNILHPTLYFLSRMAPWSLLTIVGFVLFFRNQPKSSERLLLARGLFSYFLVGVVIFSIAAHKRADHLVPLIPAGMVFAGWVLAKYYRPEITVRWIRNACFVVLLVLVGKMTYSYTWWYYKDGVQKSMMTKEFAEYVESEVGGNFPLIPVDMYGSVQYHLGTFRHLVPPEVAGKALESNAAAFVVVRNSGEYKGEGLDQYQVLHEILLPSGEPFIQLISNRSELKPQDHLIMAANKLLVEMKNLEVVNSGDRILKFESFDRTGFVNVSNPGGGEREITIQINGRQPEKIRLAPGESERIDL